MNPDRPLSIALAIAALLVAGCAGFRDQAIRDAFPSANGRIEAVEVDIATRIPGRLAEVLVHEGDFVTAGQALARMDTEILAAQREEASADVRQARSAVDAARSGASQREGEKLSATAVVAQREAELDLARVRLARAEKLGRGSALSIEELDARRAAFHGARAALEAARAGVAAADAAIANAGAQVIHAQGAADAARARLDRLDAELRDCTLRSPRDGRVQYRVAQPGEVLGAGGKVLNVVDLTDVYMSFFLPTAQAGRVQMGAEVRLVLDAAPQFVIPARVSFVADVAQFTPKTVETAVEREKLMFRIKARIEPELLKKYVKSVKTGLPGTAHLQLEPRAAWPEDLAVRLPP